MIFEVRGALIENCGQAAHRLCTALLRTLLKFVSEIRPFVVSMLKVLIRYLAQLRGERTVRISLARQNTVSHATDLWGATPSELPNWG